MTDTITLKERRTWRDECKNWTGRDSEIVIRMRLLNALEATEAQLERSCEETSELYRMATEIVPELKKRLEAAEARAVRAETLFLEHVPGIIRQKTEQAEARADFASSVLQAASDCIVSGDPASDVGLFLECDEFDKKLLVDIAALRTRAEKANTENARLWAERDWLANALAWGAGKDKKPLFDRLPWCDSREKWKEAARRAVAGEGEVRK